MKKLFLITLICFMCMGVRVFAENQADRLEKLGVKAPYNIKYADKIRAEEQEKFEERERLSRARMIQDSLDSCLKYQKSEYGKGVYWDSEKGMCVIPQTLGPTHSVDVWIYGPGMRSTWGTMYY